MMHAQVISFIIIIPDRAITGTVPMMTNDKRHDVMKPIKIPVTSATMF